MKTAVVTSPNAPIVIEDRLIPQPKAGEVLIKVHACGVCHSDLMVLLGHFPFATYPRVPGHEVAGVVEKVGEGVTWPKVGDRVGVPWLFSACGHCDQCVRGAEILCPFATVTGVTQDGGYQEYMVAPALYVAPIPDELSFAEAGPLMCAGLTVFNGMRQAGFRPGQKVAVIGLGGLGHLAVLYAKAMGGRVAVISELARQTGRGARVGRRVLRQHQGAKGRRRTSRVGRWRRHHLGHRSQQRGGHRRRSRPRTRRNAGRPRRGTGQHRGQPDGFGWRPSQGHGFTLRRAQ